MNDNVIMENYLLVLKSNVEVFVHGTLESSNSDVQNLLKNCLSDTIDCQRKTYTLMVEEGIYQTQNVDKQSITNCLQKLNSNS